MPLVNEFDLKGGSKQAKLERKAQNEGRIYSSKSFTGKISLALILPVKLRLCSTGKINPAIILPVT